MKALEILYEYATIDFGCNMEEHHKEINEAIAELEALQQPKSCEGCKHYNFTYSHQDGAVRKFEVMCSDCIRTNTKDRYKDHEAQLKAKDEEIERLKALVDEVNKFEEAHIKE